MLRIRPIAFQFRNHIQGQPENTVCTSICQKLHLDACCCFPHRDVLHSPNKNCSPCKIQVLTPHVLCFLFIEASYTLLAIVRAPLASPLQTSQISANAIARATFPVLTPPFEDADLLTYSVGSLTPTPASVSGVCAYRTGRHHNGRLRAENASHGNRHDQRHDDHHQKEGAPEVLGEGLDEGRVLRVPHRVHLGDPERMDRQQQDHRDQK